MTELAGAFFTTTDGTWFTPTDASLGPWDPDACHGGPPAGLRARSVERLVSDQRLTRRIGAVGRVCQTLIIRPA